MAKEILLYGGIWTYSVTDIIEKLSEAGTQNVLMRVNTGGGSPEDCFGICAKMKEMKGTVDLTVDGRADSSGFFFLLYANGKVKALDVSNFTVHRAAYSSYIERDLPDASKSRLANINAKLREAMEARIDVAAFERITGKTMDDLFSMESRIDIHLTADQALEVGLIDEIIKVTPDVRASLESNFEQYGIAAHLPAVSASNPTNEPSKSSIMNLEQFKAKHPEIYAEAVKVGVTKERDRVETWMVFADVDIKKVTEGIEKGDELTGKVQAELTRASIADKGAKDIEAESAGDAPTDKPEGEGGEGKEDTPEAKAKAKAEAAEKDFQSELNAELGLSVEDGKGGEGK